MAPQLVLWKKRILVPFWAVRICVCLLIIVVYAWALSNMDEFSAIERPAVAASIALITFIVIVVLIDALAILLFLRDALKPGTFLTMNCFQTGFWAGVLIMDIVAVTRTRTGAAGIGFDVFIFLTFFGTFVYSIVQYRRGKAAVQRGQYAPAHNPAAPAPAGIPSPYSSAPEYQPNTAYHSQTTPPVEMHDQYRPPYPTGAAGDYYQQQPVKPAHIV